MTDYIALLNSALGLFNLALLVKLMWNDLRRLDEKLDHHLDLSVGIHLEHERRIARLEAQWDISTKRPD